MIALNQMASALYLMVRSSHLYLDEEWVEAEAWDDWICNGTARQGAGRSCEDKLVRGKVIVYEKRFLLCLPNRYCRNRYLFFLLWENR